MTITDRQQQVLEFIRHFLADEGYSPSVREICHGLGLSSPGSLFKHLRVLEDRGHLIRTPGKNRSWRPAERAPMPSIPLIGQIAAGSPVLAEENWEDEIPIDPTMFGFPDCFALRVRGDSMVEAFIDDGDLAVIRPQPLAQPGQIVAVMVDGLEPEATLKIFRKGKNTVELHPANQAYTPMVFEGREMNRIRIIGRLVGVIRTLNH